MDITYDIAHLKKIVATHKKKDDKEPLAFCFYGGEPLLKRNIMEQVVDMFPNAVFCLQTNATFMRMVKTPLINKMTTILASIDGDGSVTDACRGKGTYAKVCTMEPT